MKKIIFLLLLISNIALQDCVGMELSFPEISEEDCSWSDCSDNEEEDKPSQSYSLIDFFKQFEGFDAWFSQKSKEMRGGLKGYYHFYVDLKRFIPACSIHEVFFSHVFCLPGSLVKAAEITDEGSFDDLDVNLIENRYNLLQFQERFRKIQVVIVINFIKCYVAQNPLITTWQQLRQIIGGLMKGYCSKDMLFNDFGSLKKSRLICYLLFRSPEQVYQAIKLYQASKNLSDEDVKKIVKKRKREENKGESS